MLIECKNLSVSLRRREILKDISLSVNTGEIVTIIGPNGSGKSTLFKAIIGAVPCTSGVIHKKLGLRVGYVPQKLHIDEALPITVKRFMNLPRGHSHAAIKEALENAGVSGLATEQLMDFSGGQFQRVLLARALLCKPDLLLLDEATQGLDHRGSAEFYRQISRVRDKLGCGIIMISHELHVVMRQTDRVICLNGNICCQGKPEAVSDSPEYYALFGLERDTESARYVHHNQPLNQHSEHHPSPYQNEHSTEMKHAG